MKLSRKIALSAVAVGVLGALGNAVAAPVYEIINLDKQEYDFVGEGNGTLPNTRNGYAQAVNNNDQLVGVALGRKVLKPDDVDTDIVDSADGISSSVRITLSTDKEIEGNNYAFSSSDNTPDNKDWVPIFESFNGAKAPGTPNNANSINSQLFGINAAGIQVGSMSGPQRTLPFTGEKNDNNKDQKFWYFRDYETRGVIKKGDVEIPLIPPYHTYKNSDNKTAEVGGLSTASAINDSNLVVGYASTDIADSSTGNLDNCLKSDAKEPVEVCVQDLQFGTRPLPVYQIRAQAWQLKDDNTVTSIDLPLGLTPDSDSKAIFQAQAVGVNNDGVIVGRSDTYRGGDKNNLRYDAAYWKKDADGKYQYQHVPNVSEKDDRDSIAYAINNAGILVGSYSAFIEGRVRSKFFYYDTKAAGDKVVVPNDFKDRLTDLTSVPRDINNNNQVVGSIETDFSKTQVRPRAGFLFEMGSKDETKFHNLNNLLTCQSKGYEPDGDSWKRHQVEVEDGSGKKLSYSTRIEVVEANSINDDGTIVGTALITKPRYQIDDDGKPVIDPDSKKPLFELNALGQPVTASIPRMVVLKPVNDTSASACTFSDVPGEKPYERKGAGMLFWIFALPLAFLRRRKF
ncbi:DUF3466 family protein [Parashewanella curva]|uniref:DUF3466 family protein n=1 Tax=Parashewanella curva TaxID=2338552 RepID=A0A3L8PV68_9GAMM|nr:DUF3466 family protein [Parashewanella curva]RLV57942.1 DUF3466 family protein [Parashewanella curva]